jgi:SAM-dependent methyltransferase
MTHRDAKRLSKQRFGERAQRYVQSAAHAFGADLQRMIDLAQPQPHENVLDIAAGGGHTALAFASYVREVIASDLTQAMLNAAKRDHTAKGISNIRYVLADAEQLTFPDASFDLVTCRIAPHHFPDVYRFAVECYRVLKPGGRLIIMDQTVPEDEPSARYIDAFERLRDPSHHRLYSEIEWRGTFLDAGFAVLSSEIVTKPTSLFDWAKVQDCSPQIIERLQILLTQAPKIVHDWWQSECVGTADAKFRHTYVIIAGKKTIT